VTSFVLLLLPGKWKKMDGFTEKKWFVYIGDKHEGPFSLEEIQGQMTQGRVSTESYVWADGMADWKAMPEVPDFSPLVQKPPIQNGKTEPVAPHVAPSVNTPAEPEPSSPVLEAQPKQEEKQEEKTGDLDPEDLKRVQETSIAVPPVVRSRALGRAITGLVFLVVIAGVYKTGYLSRFSEVAGVKVVSEQLKSYLITLGEKVPFLDQWISPIPTLEDVAPREYAELQQTAKAKITAGSGAQLALALSRSDLLAPSFYISTNIPEPVSVHLYIVGVSDTLLNQNSFFSEVDVKIAKKIGKTPGIRMADGQLIPRGEYGIYVVAGENQPLLQRTLLANIPPLPIKTPSEVPKDAKILAFKSTFLGGNRDATYASRLKDFHDKLRTKASNELGEIRQFVTTVESQFASTNVKFGLLKKIKVSTRNRKQWEDFHTEWMKLQEQMDQIFRKWTPEVLSQEYFYGTLYQLVQQAGISVQKVHEFHHAYFVGVSDQKTFEIQLGEASSSASNALTLLKAKVDQVEKLAPTPNGMPRRDDL
jgi:hypothetical protein